MVHLSELKSRNFLALTAALAAVSGCTTAVSSATGPTAGGPSGHTPQNYETLTSTAATTSTLGGSALVANLDISGEFVSATAVATAGSTTHSTGSITLDDGTYLFIDADGPNSSGHITDGNGAEGFLGANTFQTSFGTYDYVTPYSISYMAGGQLYGSVGVAGLITGSSDMPIAGSATYTGEAIMQLIPDSSASTNDELYFHDGVSAVSVDFGAGTANVILGNFANIEDAMGGSLTAATAAFDELRGTGMLISGSHFTGGTWVTVSQGAVVNVVGAGQTTTSNGTFFGYDPSISAPDEVGGVVVIGGGTATVIGLYLAD